jgi:hypothetical protein
MKRPCGCSEWQIHFHLGFFFCFLRERVSWSRITSDGYRDYFKSTLICMLKIQSPARYYLSVISAPGRLRQDCKFEVNLLCLKNKQTKAPNWNMCQFQITGCCNDHGKSTGCDDVPILFWTAYLRVPVLNMTLKTVRAASFLSNFRVIGKVWFLKLTSPFHIM